MTQTEISGGSMNTDKELLEKAAKAAGIIVKRNRLDDPAMQDMLIVANRNAHSSFIGWNPLTDDGDAFRLAVKLGIRDYFGIEIQKTCAQATAFEPWEHCEYEEYKDQDPYSATRRAIVRAAAAIGETL